MAFAQLFYRNSPFVSVTTDMNMLARTVDTSLGGLRELLLIRPEIVLLCVPDDIITTPEQAEADWYLKGLGDAKREGEVVVRPPTGSIEPYILRRLPNPHYNPPPQTGLPRRY